MVRLEQRLELKQQLTPQQVLQASILQLNVINLEQRILDELEENPALELLDLDPEDSKENDSPDESEDSSKTKEEAEEPATPELDEKKDETDFDWEELLGDPDEYEYRQHYSESEEYYQAPIKATRTFAELLIEQFIDLDPPDDEVEIAEELIGNIDDDGYLTADLLLIADRFQVDEAKVASVLYKIQRLEPAGMGARDLRECLIAQLSIQRDHTFATEILEEYFEDFANHRYQRILNGLKCSREELHEAMEVISQLNPRPGSSVVENEKDFVIPDLIMERQNDEWLISINDTTLPPLRISNQYIQMLQSYNDRTEVRKFVQKKLEAGRWFIDAINQRRQTMLNVMQAIVRHQDLFFRDSGKRVLRPMVLKDIAENVHMDISTISRVTNGKYVQLPFGIFELKEFFSEGIDTSSGERVSNTIVKDRIRELIDAEIKQNPVGDEDLTRILNNEGFKVARRTVSKYREQLKIPVARLRKEL